MTSHKVLPRYNVAQARERLAEIERKLAGGSSCAELVEVSFGSAAPNATGGQAATTDDLAEWRHRIVEALAPVARPQTKLERDQHGIVLGRALEEVICPSPSDAAHDGVWSFLALMIFPDTVYARWPLSGGALPADRWIGKQGGGRDRNYLKLAWRRWIALGPILEAADGRTYLGEDEFGALLERSSLARNKALIRAAAREIINFQGSGPRMLFARDLMKLITYQTGPLDLEILSEEDLVELVRSCAESAAGARLVGGAPSTDVMFIDDGEDVVVQIREPAHPRRAQG